MALDDAPSRASQPNTPPRPDALPRRSSGPNRAATNRAARRIALVADLDPSVVWLLRRALADDFDLTIVASGARAVELADSAEPDVILLDPGVPILDGFGACRRLRAAWPLVPIVIVSGQTDEESVRAAFEAGATDYVTRPFAPSQLRARLRACLLRRV